MTSFTRAAILVAGVYVFYLGFGVTQEKIYKTGESGDVFTYSFFLVFLTCLSNAMISGGMLLAQGSIMERFKRLDYEVYRETFLSSLTYVTSMLASNYALTNVSYPTQVIVKSIKMVPVTVGGFVFYRKKYPWYDYVAVVVISLSLVLFNFAKPASAGKAATQQSTLGIFLLLVSLACDSATGPRQDKLLSRYKFLTPVEMMFLTNLFATGTTGICAFAIEGPGAFQFCARHPHILRHILAFCLCGSAGQLFIFGCLTSFGSLYLTLITTTRKFFTVLLSVVVFGHHVNPAQWTCVAAIFGSLGVQSYYAKSSKSKKTVTSGVELVNVNTPKAN